MGFFDEESSGSGDEADQSETKKKNDDDDNSNHNEDGDDEDPLDAYMKSLEDGGGGGDEQQQQHDSATTTTEKRPQQHERLDLENEDEDDDEEEDVLVGNDNSASSRYAHHQAQRALDGTFRRATDYHSSSTATATAATEETVVAVQKCFWRQPPGGGNDTPAGRAWRRDHRVTVSPLSGGNGSGGRPTGNNGSSILMDPVRSFAELAAGLSLSPNDDDDDGTARSLCDALQRRFPAGPTVVQSQALPLALSGRDCVVTAATGQGKTLAYAWPAAWHCRGNVHVRNNNSNSNNTTTMDDYSSSPSSSSLRAVILVPTRELAQQVHAQAVAPWMELLQLRSHCVIGGQGRWKLLQELGTSSAAGGGIHLVVATPGRLLDVVSSSNSNNPKKRGLSLHATTFVVLDECDKLLSMGFEPQVRQILQKMPPTRQTMLLSATMSRKVERVAREWLRDARAVRIAVGRTGAASEHVTQHAHVLPDVAAKDRFVVELLPALVAVGRTLIFVATREGCERLADTVRAQCPANVAQTVATLHGDKHQSDRTKAVRALTKGTLSVLIASDVAARGLDLPHVQTVLQYDVAKNWDAHVHRVGRAGRLCSTTAQQQQQTGTAHTLLTPRDHAFAGVLVRAFEREGREVTPELEALANSKPSSYGGGHSHSHNKSSRVRRTHGNRHQAGLGYAPPPDDDSEGAANKNHHCYYGPNGGPAPPAKRGRWS